MNKEVNTRYHGLDALKGIAMFQIKVFAEIKFILAIFLTSIICLATYKLFVRSTIMGLLLNRKTYLFRN